MGADERVQADEAIWPRDHDSYLAGFAAGRRAQDAVWRARMDALAETHADAAAAAPWWRRRYRLIHKSMAALCRVWRKHEDPLSVSPRVAIGAYRKEAEERRGRRG